MAKENKTPKKKLEQVNEYSKKKREEKKKIIDTLPNKIDIPSEFSEAIFMRKIPVELNKIANENYQIKTAEKIFSILNEHLPRGIFKHLTIIMYEHDREVNHFLKDM